MKCSKHTEVEMSDEEDDCRACEGDGRDPSEMDGVCLSCRGKGAHYYRRCERCEEEHQDELDAEADWWDQRQYRTC